jgi:hypothetical protein
MYSQRGWSYGSARRSARPAGGRPQGGAGLSWLARAPLPVALALVGAATWYHFAFGGFAFAGSVVDAESGHGVAGARVWSGSALAQTDADGRFRLAAAKPPELVSIEAPGYAPRSVRASLPPTLLSVALEPKTAQLQVVDAETGSPIPTARAAAPVPAQPLGDGRFLLTTVEPGQQVQAQAEGYVGRTVAYDGRPEPLRVELAPRYAGQVLDASSGKPVAQAYVALGGGSTATDADGAFAFVGPLASRQLIVLAPGYKRATLEVGGSRTLDVRLEPIAPRALYLTHDAVRLAEFRSRLFELLSTTELNAVVIDVKGDRGYLTYRSRVPLAQQIGANDRPTAEDIDQLLQTLHGRGVYAIARIVVFKDDLLARNGAAAGADVAIKDGRTGRPWVDGEGLAWVDAFQPAAWDYNAALAREAIERGFDEVQFDYIRFPTDAGAGSSLADTAYSQPFTRANRVGALKAFLGRAHAAVRDAGGFLGIDVFGLSAWWEHSDGGIGQDLAELADSVDYVCPMLYPSTFASGLPGGLPYPDVVTDPYKVIWGSVKHLRENQMAGSRAVVRPWLQYFDDYGDQLGGYRYDAPQIEAQTKAAAEAGAVGWMLWDPRNAYDRGGLAPR